MTATISRILPFLNKLIPQHLAVKGIEKINPKFTKLMSKAASYGYGANEVLDFMREQNGMESTEGLRPDQQANEQQLSQSQSLPKAALAAGKVGAGIAGGAALSGLLEMGDQAIRPDEITQMPQNPRQIGNQRQQLQIGQDQMGNVPNEGEVITPPISPQQQQQANGYSKSERSMEEKFGRLMAQRNSNQQRPEQQQQKNQVDQAILAALEKILQM